MSVEYTPMMKVRDRTVWLTDHPGATVRFKRGGKKRRNLGNYRTMICPAP